MQQMTEQTVEEWATRLALTPEMSTPNDGRRPALACIAAGYNAAVEPEPETVSPWCAIWPDIQPYLDDPTVAQVKFRGTVAWVRREGKSGWEQVVNDERRAA